MVTVTKTKPTNRMAKKLSSKNKSSESAKTADKDGAKSFLDNNPQLKTALAQIEKEFEMSLCMRPLHLPAFSEAGEAHGLLLGF